jgi:hypothetical protein
VDTEAKKRYVPTEKEKRNYAWLHGGRRQRSLQPVVKQTAEERALEVEAMQTLVRVCNGEDRMDATPPEIDVDSELDSREDQLVAMIDWKRAAERRQIS